GVQERVRAREPFHGVMIAVVLPDATAEPVITERTAQWQPLDVAVLVRWHGLGRELTTEPVRRLGQDHPLPQRRRGHGRGATTQAAADDQDVGPALAWRPPRSPSPCRAHAIVCTYGRPRGVAARAMRARLSPPPSAGRDRSRYARRPARWRARRARPPRRPR